MPTTKPRALQVTDLDDQAPAPFTITGDDLRLAINLFDGQLLLDTVTGALRICSERLALTPDEISLGTAEELRACYLAHGAGPDAYADHLSAQLGAEVEAGRL